MTDNETPKVKNPWLGPENSKGIPGGEIDKGGRPRIDLKPEELKYIAAAVGKGFTMEEVADLLGMSRATLYRRIGEDSEVLRQFQASKTVYKEKVVNAAWKKIEEGDAGMIKFILATKYGYVKAQEVQHTGKGGERIMTPLKGLSDGELIDEALTGGNITPAQADELRQMLKVEDDDVEA